MNDLAIKLRPNKLSDIIGQQHLVGPGKIINNLIKNKKIFSMILFGDPGIGKTSLATAIIGELDCRHRFLNAVINNKKDFDQCIEEAKMYGNLIIIMDEIHRLNKDKQDLLLPYIENNTITLLGLTTANPYYKINPAIRSRCQIFELKPLVKEDLEVAIKKVIESNILTNIKIDEDAVDYLIKLSSGDLRYLYNTIEIAYYCSNNGHVTLNILKDIANKPVLYSDSNGDNHYDLLSAFQKSIRGSDVDAAIYYLARLIESDDFESIYRRLLVITYEDIGLANTSMGPKVTAAINACERLGMPEARIPLSSIVIELALSPKSNSAYKALDLAINGIRMGENYNTPSHIKTHSPNYKYPHDYNYSYIKQQYLPDEIINRRYYFPKNNQNELKFKNIYENLKK